MPSAVVEGIEYLEDRKIDKNLLLRLSNCAYIDERHLIILSGASDCGKSYIACALGNAACRKFYHACYTRKRNLLDGMNLVRTEECCRKALKALAKADLLILDEWLLQPLSPQEVYDCVSCTNTPFKPSQKSRILSRSKAPVAAIEKMSTKAAGTFSAGS